MRRLLMLCTALIFSLDAAAAPGTVQSQGWVLEFIKKSQLNKRSRSFKELLKEWHGHLDPQGENYLQDLSERASNLEIPQIQINKIKNDRGGEDLQFQIVQKDQSATIDMVEKNDALEFKITGAYNKTPKTVKFSTSDSPEAMYKTVLSVMQEVGMTAARKPGFDSMMLTAHDVQKLSPSEKAQYFKKLRKVMSAAEKVPLNFETVSSKRKTSSIWDVLLDPAFAAGKGRPDGSPCMIAGYATTYQGGVCGDSSVQKYSDGTIQCNTAIYGTTDTGQPYTVSPNDPPGRCGDLSQDSTNPFPKGIKNTNDFDRERASAIAALQMAVDACKDMGTAKDKGTKGKGANACGDLERRFRELTDLQCNQLQQRKDRFPDLNCSTNPGDVVPVPEKPPIPDPGNTCPQHGCPDQELTCPKEQQQEVPQCPGMYRCKCKDGEEPIMKDGGTYEIGCKPAGGATSSGGGGTSSGKCPKCGLPGWVIPAIIGAGGLGLLLGFLFKKTKTVTNTVTVPGPTTYVPNPIPGQPIPVPVPVPVLVPVPVPEPYTTPVRPGVM